MIQIHNIRELRELIAGLPDDKKITSMFVHETQSPSSAEDLFMDSEGLFPHFLRPLGSEWK